MQLSLAGLEGLSLGWRELLLVLILAIVIYMIWLLWRMRRISRRQEAPRPLREPRVASPLDNLGDEEEAEAEPLVYAMPPRGPDTEPAWTSADTAGFAQQAFMDGVERELEQVREEMDALRGALAGLREEMAGLREEFQQEVLATRAAQNASPLYSDAMQMAILGHDALTISERCGIARAEAELVVALVKNKDGNSP